MGEREIRIQEVMPLWVKAPFEQEIQRSNLVLQSLAIKANVSGEAYVNPIGSFGGLLEGETLSRAINFV
jgi:hypothetical protein